MTQGAWGRIGGVVVVLVGIGLASPRGADPSVK